MITKLNPKRLVFNSETTVICPWCDKHYEESALTNHTRIHADDLKRAVDGVLSVEHNEKHCPWCGFEGTVDVIDAQNLRVLRNMCVNVYCHWQKRVN